MQIYIWGVLNQDDLKVSYWNQTSGRQDDFDPGSTKVRIRKFEYILGDKMLMRQISFGKERLEEL